MSRIHLLLVGLLVFPCVAIGDTSLNVMSFNIRYGTDGQGRDSWGERRGIVANTIKEHAPDVVGLQECIDFQAEYLVEQLPEYQWIGMGREADGGHEMTAVLYRKSSLSLVESRNYWLSETPSVPGSISWDSGYVRMATQVKFMHREEGTFFHFVNTHLDSKGKQARLEGAKLILEQSESLAAEAPVIITGDFNALAEKEGVWPLFMDAGYVDAWLVAEKQVGPEITMGRFRAPREGAVARIDWVLVKGNVSVARCETSLYNEDKHYPSDHYPVVARLTLKE